ncbi:MAG: hypothetical protein WCP95_08770 [Actinomycetes bacterium]
MRAATTLVVSATLVVTVLAPAHAAHGADRGRGSAPVSSRLGSTAPAGPMAMIPTIDPPRAMDVRLRNDSRGMVAVARTRILVNSSGVAGRLPDRVVVVVSVRDTTGTLLPGPEQAALVGDGGRTGSTIEVDPTSGVVDVRVPLTAEQTSAVDRLRRLRGEAGAAPQVLVRVLQQADVSTEWPGREALAVIERRATSSSAPLAQPVPAVRDDVGTVTVQNSTGNPLTLLAGPVQCVYDNFYASTQYTNQQSFLGSMNGAALPAGSSMTVHLSKDPQGLDGKDNDFLYQQAIADYQQAVSNAFAWMQNRGVTTLPKMGFPYSKNNPMSLPPELWQNVGLFIGHSLMDVLSGTGVFARLTSEFLLKNPIFKTAFAALSESFGTILDFASALFEVVIAIVQALITFFTNGCDTNSGYFMLGATDMLHPWRQFAQVYNWNDGIVEAAYDSSQKKNYVALANGMITRYLPAAASNPADISANDYLDAFNGAAVKLAPTWVFQEPPNKASYPASVSVDPKSRTVTCGLDARDSAALTANLKAQQAIKGTSYYLPVYPASLWFSMTDSTFTQAQPSAASYPYDYFVGSQYVSPSQGSTASVWASPDGTHWTQYPVPQGSNSVVLPPAHFDPLTPFLEVAASKLVSCTVEAPEMWNVNASPLPTGRALIMGTIVPSDVVKGPDYPASS